MKVKTRKTFTLVLGFRICVKFCRPMTCVWIVKKVCTLACNSGSSIILQGNNSHVKSTDNTKSFFSIFCIDWKMKIYMILPFEPQQTLHFILSINSNKSYRITYIANILNVFKNILYLYSYKLPRTGSVFLNIANMSIVYKITNILSIFFFPVRRYRIEDINVTHIEDINVSGKFYIVVVVLMFFMSQLSCANI